MTLNESIASVIATLFPHIIYVDDIGEGFTQPSFFIYQISDKSDAFNNWTYSNETLIQIVYFGERDEHNLIKSKEDQRQTINTIKHKFMCTPAIKYDDTNWGKILETSVGYTGDKDMYLQLKLQTTIGTREDYDTENPSTTANELHLNIGN